MTYRSHHDNIRFSLEEFTAFRDYLQDISGIDLGQNKQYLVASRLRRILLEANCSSLMELTRLIRQPSQSRWRQSVIDAMTTNETFWFRDTYPYEYLRKEVLPVLSKVNENTRTRIWSAACSSGQEPYSISMIVDEFKASFLGSQSFSVDITATDVSNKILETAKGGVYDRLSISRGLSEHRLKTFFEPEDDGSWVAKETIKKRISYRALNLKDSFSSLGKFDIIFCRNVLIYFSSELKLDIIQKIHGSLKPGGLLFLGASEGLSESKDLFQMIHCNPGTVYKSK